MDEQKIDMQEEVTPGNPTSNQDTIVSQEEQEWSSLKGSTQDRVRQVISERNEYKKQLSSVEERLKALEATPKPVVPPAPSLVNGELTPEQKKAIDTLRGFGIATKEDLQALKDQQIIEETYGKLEERYNGEDGRPAFNRSEIEKHMQATGIYNPEKAYKDKYEEELFDFKMKERQGAATPSYTSRPSGSSRGQAGEPLSVESLRERMNKPDGKVWWEKNRSKILPLMSELMK